MKWIHFRLRAFATSYTCTELTLIPCSRERKELQVFHELVKMVPSLEARLVASSEDEVIGIADLVRLLLPSLDLSYVLTSIPDSEGRKWGPCG